jgi:hypothetical protein
MNFTYNDLVPEGAKGGSGPQAAFLLPLTPFFMPPTNAIIRRTTRGFLGDDFISQFTFTNKFDEHGVLTNDPIPGTAAYRVFTSVDFDEFNPWNGSRTYSYVFDTSTNEVRVDEAVVGRPTIGLTHTRTANTAKQGDAFNNPPDHIEITLSEPVDKAWLAGEWARWMARPEAFRVATGNGLGTYAYTGHGATSSQSDGYYGVVGGGEVVVRGPTFYGTFSGMVGDAGAFWNGNFATFISKVRRKNAPILYGDFGSSWPSDMRAGTSNYRAGYTDEQLSEPLGDVWRDKYGVFDMDNVLSAVPMEASPIYLNDLLTYYQGDGAAHELMLVSRTGKRYRVTVETGGYEYTGDYDVVWHTARSYVVTTDPATLRATLTMDAPGENEGQARYAMIEEEKVIDGVTVWEVVADMEGELPNPSQMIGANVTGDFLLLEAAKIRRGTRFGFTPFDYSSTTRYRKRTFEARLNTGDYTIPEGWEEFGTAISGSLDFAYTEEFDPQTGLQLPREVSEWSMTMNGVDWTRQTPSWAGGFSGSSLVVNTPTRLRHEGSYLVTGLFHLGFDAPDPGGMILDTSWVEKPMVNSGSSHQAAPEPLNPPAPGSSLFFEGHRLTY